MVSGRPAACAAGTRGASSVRPFRVIVLRPVPPPPEAPGTRLACCPQDFNAALEAGNAVGKTLPLAITGGVPPPALGPPGGPTGV